MLLNRSSSNPLTTYNHIMTDKIVQIAARANHILFMTGAESRKPYLTTPMHQVHQLGVSASL